MIALWLTAQAYVPSQTCGGTPSHWAASDLPTTWYLRTGVNGGQAYGLLSDTQVQNALQAGWDVWTDTTTCCSGFTSVYAGTTTSPGSGNSQNVIEFDATWDPALGSANSTIAVTRTSYNPSNCRILSSDQVYNADRFDFSVSTTPGFGFTDLQSIAAHENGHWLGLGHSPTGAATMYYAYSGGTAARTLHPDDEDGVCDIYPGTCGPAEADCDDGVDDDSDGDIDCNDSDCANYPVCSCVVDGVVGCDNTITGDNFGGGETVQQFGCANFPTSGPEAVYTFVPNEDGPVTITLSNMTADLDLFVTTESSGSCEPNQCLELAATAGNETLTFDATAGETYAVVADGYQGAESAFTLSVDCPDPVGGGHCEAEQHLVCGEAMGGSNFGAENNVQEFSCAGWQTTGPEQVFLLETGADGPVTLDLSGLTADLDLFVTTTAGDECDTGNCVGVSGNGNASPEHLEFQATAGVTYMVVVDGWDGATSDFTLLADCVPPPDPPTPPIPTDTDTPTDTDLPPTVPGETDAPTDTGDPGPRDTGIGPIEGCLCSNGGGTLSFAWIFAGLLVLRRR